MVPIQPKQPTAKGPAEWFTGDVINTPAQQWHWHGAAPDHFMTHLSITEATGDERPEADWPATCCGSHGSSVAGPRRSWPRLPASPNR